MKDRGGGRGEKEGKRGYKSIILHYYCLSDEKGGKRRGNNSARHQEKEGKRGEKRRKSVTKLSSLTSRSTKLRRERTSAPAGKGGAAIILHFRQ